MPALTHGRVKNGFNLLPRTITYSQGKCRNDSNSTGQTMDESVKRQNGSDVCSQIALCCGKPLQYTSMRGANLLRNTRIPTKPSNRKLANNVTVGRSFAAKRAIARRSATVHRIKDKDHPDDRSKDTIEKCCLLPTVTYSQPRNAYNNPCSGGLIKNKLLDSCTNPTKSTAPYQNGLNFASN